jgi:ABC-type polysaccharide/polyol phosphate transport system ATPase subunit
MISVRELTKSYPTRSGPRRILDGIDFDLRRGQKLGVLGRNGSGKSTLIRLLSGAERPTSGTVTRTMSVSWPLAFSGAFQGSLTGLDNYKFICRIYGVDYRERLDYIDDFAELGRYMREPVKNYSAGMRARLAFAISMAVEFDCFLIDEVISVGDARFHAKCEIELFEKRADRSFIMVSHEAHNIEKHCDCAAVLNEGRLTTFTDLGAAYSYYQSVLA